MSDVARRVTITLMGGFVYRASIGPVRVGYDGYYE